MAAQCPSCGAVFRRDHVLYRLRLSGRRWVAYCIGHFASRHIHVGGRSEPKVAESACSAWRLLWVEQATPSASPADISADVIDGDLDRSRGRRAPLATIRRDSTQAKAGAEGTVYVTDSRVVFLAQTRAKATSRASTIIQQTKVDVTGFGAHVSRKVNIFLVLATILLGVGSSCAHLLRRNSAC